jgi:rubrerythrin
MARLLGRIRELLAVDQTIHECRHCGTTVASETETCPECGTNAISSYRIQ